MDANIYMQNADICMCLIHQVYVLQVMLHDPILGADKVGTHGKSFEKSRLQINFTTLFPNGPACISRGFLCSKQGQHYERYMRRRPLWRRWYIMSWILWRDRDIIRGGYLKFSKTSSSKEPELSYQALFGTHIKGIVMKGREGSYKMRILWNGEMYDIKWGYYETGRYMILNEDIMKRGDVWY